MSEHFFTFVGHSMPGGSSLISISGINAGDRILDVLSISGSTIGSFTNSFLPFAPASGVIVQGSEDLGAFTFLLRVERQDI